MGTLGSHGTLVGTLGLLGLDSAGKLLAIALLFKLVDTLKPLPISKGRNSAKGGLRRLVCLLNENYDPLPPTPIRS